MWFQVFIRETVMIKARCARRGAPVAVGPSRRVFPRLFFNGIFHVALLSARTRTRVLKRGGDAKGRGDAPASPARLALPLARSFWYDPTPHMSAAFPPRRKDTRDPSWFSPPG